RGARLTTSRTRSVSPKGRNAVGYKGRAIVHTGPAFDREKAATPDGPLGFGFQTPLHGVLEYGRAKQAFFRFDVVTPGEVWGRWGDANGKSLFAERPGNTPFGSALELAGGGSARRSRLTGPPRTPAWGRQLRRGADSSWWVPRRAVNPLLTVV